MAYLLSEGKCGLCGSALPDDFHVDHIKPYAEGGVTELWNLHATCPPCNLRKGAKEI